MGESRNNLEGLDLPHIQVNNGEINTEASSGTQGPQRTRSVRLHYQLDGPADAPVVVFSNSLGADISMWEPQMPAFMREFRVLRYDTRGHGKSETTPGPYTIELLSRDVTGLLDGLGVSRAHFCGLSMGGAIGLWLGIHAADRIAKLMLCNTAAQFGSADAWNARIANVQQAKMRQEGMAALVPAIMQRWFTECFLASGSPLLESTRKMLLRCPPDGYIACCEAIRDVNLTGEVARVKARALIISGSHDPATPPRDGRFLADNIPGARYAELNASHLSNIEAAQEFTDVALQFLGEREAS